MGRPEKRGLTYFPLDCVQDDNLTFIEAKHGIEGFGILIKIWQKIYRNDGYYMHWNEQNMYLFAREIAVNMDVISSVVNTCLLPNISIFNEKLFKAHGILTSTGIQKRWLSIVKSAKRKGVDIDPKYSLLEFPPEETVLNPEERAVNPSESTQRKEKEIKEYKSKEKESKEDEFYLSDLNIDLRDKILKNFNFNEVANFDKFRAAADFLKCISIGDRVKYFEEQLDAYFEYKKLTNGTAFIHSFSKFLGSPDKLYTDGAWNAENWLAKLQIEKNINQNGKATHSNTGRRSHLNPPTNSYTKL